MERAGKHRPGSLFLAAQHQLRQPLNAISLLIGELRDAAEGRDRAAIVEDMRYALQLSNAWLDSLADLEKAEQGLVQLQVQNVPLHQVFARLRDDFAGHFAAFGLDFRIVDTRAVVRGDAAILRRIVALLLDNAAKFTRQGKVLLGCRHQGSKLRVEVWDSGPGVDEKERERLFEAFYRLENEVRPHERGLGLGLAYARRLAEMSGDGLTLTSTPGRGSCFALTLRVAERPPDQAGVKEGPAVTAGVSQGDVRKTDTDGESAETALHSALPADPLAGAKVLLLAGEETEALRGSFENWGAEVSLATLENLGEALRAAPDILLADQAALTGGVSRRLLHESGKSTAVILLVDRRPGEAAGAASAAAERGHILERPVRPARLRSLCHYALTHRQSGPDNRDK